LTESRRRLRTVPPRARRLALWAAAAVALYAAVGFLVAPPIVRHQLERMLAEQLGRQVTLERVRINPFALSASMRGLHIRRPTAARMPRASRNSMQTSG
jgi:hypothetical protein